jgi:4-hydroxy-4-methyl-2-oxoglutarate aldolase
MPRNLQEIIERYRKLDSDLVYDTLNAMGLTSQQLSLAIQPLNVQMAIAGPAFTAKYMVSEEATKVATDRVEYAASGYQMIRDLYDGCVLVQDVGNDPVCGGLGENMGLSVQMQGCTGVVCDGGTRDKRALIAMGFPIFSRFSSCTLSWGRRRLVDYQIPIRMSGHLTKWVTVHPGDFVVGDADGIVVVPQELTLEVLEDAERVAEIEEQQREQLRAGMDREEVYKVNRYAHIRRVVE